MAPHPDPQPYEPPTLTVLGGVYALTQDPPFKKNGASDGFGFHGSPILHTSK